MAHLPWFEPELRVIKGAWVAERHGVRVLAPCGQEAVLRLNLEIARREARKRQPGRLIVEEAPAPKAR